MIVTAATAGAVGILAGVMSSQGGIEDKPHPKERSLIKATLDTADYLKKMAGKPLGIAGINLSVGSLLKQSQLFTGILGSFFQVAGALIDSFLMPFMPFLFDQVAKMAGFVPTANKFGQIVYDKVESMSGSIMDVWRMLVNIPWGEVWSALSLFFSDISHNFKIFPEVMGAKLKSALWELVPGVTTGKILTSDEGFGSISDVMASLSSFFSGRTKKEILLDIFQRLAGYKAVPDKPEPPPGFKTGGSQKLGDIFAQMERDAATIAATTAFNARTAGMSEAQKAEIAFGGEGAMSPKEQEEMEKLAFKQDAQKQALGVTQDTHMFGDAGH